MKPGVLLSALYIAFATGCLFSLFFGSTGISSMEKLNDRRRALSANLEDLNNRQEDLKAQLSALRSDPQAVIVEARGLGLFRRSDYVAHFNTPRPRRSYTDPGSVLRLDPLDERDSGLFRFVALGAGLLYLLVSLIFWRLQDAGSQKRG